MSTAIETRSIIVVGKTGAGKSSLLNKLIGKNHFSTSDDIESCTEKIESHTSRVNARVYVNRDRSNVREIPFGLTVFDTPGIGDSKGRSKRFLNEIAQTMQQTNFNLLIIFVKYGTNDVGFYNNLEVLRECLNGLSQSSTMIIINNVPTEAFLRRKRDKGEIVRDRKVILKEFFERISQCLGNTFRYEIFLENEDNDDKINEARYSYIREVILSRISYINTSRVRTWDQLIASFLRDFRYAVTRINEQINDVQSDLEDELNKIEFDIADVKYPFLDHGRDFNLDLGYVSNLECQITEEDYKKKHVYTNAFNENLTLILAVNEDASDSASLWNYFYGTLIKMLENLDAQRREKRENFDNFIQQKMQILEEKKQKIARLEAALENPHQHH